MTEEQLQGIASNLRRPQGEFGKDVGLKMNDGNRYINQYTIEALNPSPGDRILEIGMGNGYFVKDIISNAPDVSYTGADFSHTMVEEAERINATHIRNGNTRFILTDGESLPFENGTFNKLFTVNTLYFWEDTAKTLAEFKRVLIKGGLLIIAIRPKSNMINLPFVKYGFNTFTREEVENMLSINGFMVTAHIERTEPAQQINGWTTPMETLIVKAVST
jgi:ubiquinone/menaquinone biosynthesis C-methylase UbiE